MRSAALHACRDGNAACAWSQIRGNYEDALNPQTKLGKAVRAAVDELDVLGQLVSQGCNMLT